MNLLWHLYKLLRHWGELLSVRPWFKRISQIYKGNFKWIDLDVGMNCFNIGVNYRVPDNGSGEFHKYIQELNTVNFDYFVSNETYSSSSTSVRLGSGPSKATWLPESCSEEWCAWSSSLLSAPGSVCGGELMPLSLFSHCLIARRILAYLPRYEAGLSLHFW